MDQDQSLLIKDLEMSVTGLPAGYNVSVGWNPNRNTDVGWLVLKKGVSIDFKHLQLRDYNLNTLEKVSEQCGERDVIGDIWESLGFSDSISRTKSVEKHKSQTEVIKLSSLNGHPTVIKASVSTLDRKITSSAFEDEIVNSPEQNISENVLPSVGSVRTTCTYCNRSVMNIDNHDVKCQSKNAKNTERVKCPLCNYRVLKKSLSTHMKIHTYEKKRCPQCGIVVKQEGYERHLQESCRLRNGSSILCPVCRKTFGSMFSLSNHIAALHPNMPDGPARKLKYDDSSRQDRRLDKVEDSSDKGNGSREVVDCARFMKTGEEFLIGYDLLHPRNAFKESSCRLKFVMEVAGRMSQKTIKTLMSSSVEKSMKKFTKYIGHNIEGLEFRSNKIVLGGKELAGSIDKGLIKVSFQSFHDQAKDLISAADVEIRRNWLRTPSPAQDSEDVVLDFPVTYSVESVGFSEGATDAEESMEIEREADTEHVVEFTRF